MKNKKTYITALALALGFFGTQDVSAQGAAVRANVGVGSSTIRTEAGVRADVLRTNAVDVRARVNATTNPKRIELRAEVKDRVGNMLRERLSKIGDSFKNAIENLERTVSRIESEIEKIRSRGKDVSSSASALASAKVKVSDARLAIQAVVTMSASSTDPYATLEVLKSNNEAARSAMQEARKALLDVLKALRADIGVQMRANATTTASQ